MPRMMSAPSTSRARTHHMREGLLHHNSDPGRGAENKRRSAPTSVPLAAGRWLTIVCARPRLATCLFTPTPPSLSFVGVWTRQEDEVGGAVEMAERDDRTDADKVDDDEFLPIEPPPTWKVFRTALGSKYYFDPATEFVHYLSANGRGNYAVDPIHNRTFVYDSLADLEVKVDAASTGTPMAGLATEQEV